MTKIVDKETGMFIIGYLNQPEAQLRAELLYRKDQLSVISLTRSSK